MAKVLRWQSSSEIDWIMGVYGHAEDLFLVCSCGICRKRVKSDFFWLYGLDVSITLEKLERV